MRLPVGRHSRRESGIVGLLGALILNRLDWKKESARLGPASVQPACQSPETFHVNRESN
jgi:hypothetical protein